MDGSTKTFGQRAGFVFFHEYSDAVWCDTARLCYKAFAENNLAAPRKDLVAADAGYYSRANEEAVKEMGVRYVSIPNRSTRSEERRKLQRRRWFKQGQVWRTGCEGRISTVKRRHGLARCRYRGVDGMRWIGLGVIADNLINIGKRLVPQLA